MKGLTYCVLEYDSCMDDEEHGRILNREGGVRWSDFKSSM